MAVAKVRQESWDHWGEKALSGGARAMCGLTTLKQRWAPTVVQNHHGCFSNSPQELLEAEGKSLSESWRASHMPPE
eukprot:2574597-Pyramimonas_sp.AAC.1